MDSTIKTRTPEVIYENGDRYILDTNNKVPEVNSFVLSGILPTSKKENDEEKFNFIYSTRFWAMIIAALSVYLKSKGWIGDEEMTLLTTVSSLFVAIKTFDKTVDKFTK